MVLGGGQEDGGTLDQLTVELLVGGGSDQLAESRDLAVGRCTREGRGASRPVDLVCTKGDPSTGTGVQRNIYSGRDLSGPVGRPSTS